MIDLSIAGRFCRISVLSEAPLTPEWVEFYSGWHCDADPAIVPDIQLNVTPINGLVDSDGPAIAEFLQDDDCHLRLDLPGVQGILHFEQGRIVGQLHVDWADTFGLFASLRVALSLHAERSGGLLLHASGVWKEGRVWVFTGVSGAGKTTIASELSGDRANFSEDNVVLERTENGDVIVHATPFGDDRVTPSCPRIGILAGVYLIRQASQHRVFSPGALEASAVLLRESRAFNRDVSATEAALQTIERIISSGTCFALEFSRDSGFWALIDPPQTVQSGKKL